MRGKKLSQHGSNSSIEEVLFLQTACNGNWSWRPQDIMPPTWRPLTTRHNDSDILILSWHFEILNYWRILSTAPRKWRRKASLKSMKTWTNFDTNLRRTLTLWKTLSKMWRKAWVAHKEMSNHWKRPKRYYDWRPHSRCIDTRFIFVLVAVGEHIGNSQNCKVNMEQLRFKCESTLNGLKCSHRNKTYNSVGWSIHL